MTENLANAIAFPQEDNIFCNWHNAGMEESGFESGSSSCDWHTPKSEVAA